MVILELIYAYRRREWEKHFKRKENEWWVTDLVRCSLKRDFELKFPDLTLQEILSPPFIVGDMIHKGLECVLSEVLGEARMKVYVEKEHAVKIDVEGYGKVSIKGRIDLMVDTGSEKIGIEIKSVRSDISIPHEHHVDQVRAYNWLFNLNRTILVYVSYDRVCEFEVKDRMSVDEVKRRILERKIPRYDWECNYCIFNRICHARKRK